MRGLRRTSREPLRKLLFVRCAGKWSPTLPRFQVCYVFQQPSYKLGGGVIQLGETTWEEKFSNVNAAVSVDLTAAKYGLKTLDLEISIL